VHLTLKTWRVFEWRPFAPPGKNTTDGRRNLTIYKCVISSPCGVKGRHAKTCKMGILVGFGMATLPRQAKIRQTEGDKVLYEKCRSFVWQGERSSREKPGKWPFGGLSHGAFSPFHPKSMIIRHGTNQPPYNYHGSNLMHFLAYKWLVKGSVKSSA